jgi:hypothetical protein
MTFKHILLLSAAVTSFTAFSQNRIGISASVSNQGQIDNALSDFYYPSREDQNDAFVKSSSINLKYNLGFSYQLKNGNQLRLRTAYGTRNAESSNKEQSYFYYGRITDKQQFFEFAPGYGFSERLGKFNIGFGAELPVYLIDQYRQDSYLGYNNDEASEYNTSFMTMSGGVIFGLNGFLNLEYSFGKHLALFTELNCGAMHARLGGKMYDSSLLGGTGNGWEQKQNSTYFSGLQGQLGLAVKL